jgi:hypothetical protein
MGQAPKVQSKQVQNPTKLPFSNVDLVWVKSEDHGGSNKKSIDVTYAHVQDILEGKWGDLCAPMEWNIHKNMLAQKNVKNPII